MPESEAAVPQIKSCEREFKGEFQKELLFFFQPCCNSRKAVGETLKNQKLCRIFFSSLNLLELLNCRDINQNSLPASAKR